MKNSLHLVLLPLLFILGIKPAQSQDQESLHYRVQARILVFDRPVSTEKIIEWAEENDGYFTWKSEESLGLRLPNNSVESFRNFLENISEQVIEYNQDVFDLREKLGRSRSALKAREEILAKNLLYLADSDVEGTLALEVEIRRLMDQIDQHKGKVQRWEQDQKMALIQIVLAFQEPSISEENRSRFDWINSVDFSQFMAHPMKEGQPSLGGGPKISLPEGFAPVDTPSAELLAFSPQGLRLRVKRVANYPQQSLEFWTETLFGYLEKQGYRRFNQEAPAGFSDKNPFISSLWALRYGNKDYLYLTGLRIQKKKIEILELAGKAELFLTILKPREDF